jgi:Tfp pilus assembly protein PilX
VPNREVAHPGIVTMRTYFATLRSYQRFLARRLSATAPFMNTAKRARAGLTARARSQAGFMLLEVLISALLVGLIAVGTFAGFDSAGRARADERAHAQATQLAEEDEERLRGLTTTQLAQLGTDEAPYKAENGICLEKVSNTYYYWNKESTDFCEKTPPFSGTVYTGLVFSVTSSAEFFSATKEKEGLTCETSGGTADYIRTKSSVTWPALTAAGRPPVSESSVVSNPSGTELMVKVENQDKEAVSGATVSLEGVASETTPTSGCVIFGALESGKTYKVAVEKSNWVDVNGNGTSGKPAIKEYTAAVGLGKQEFKIAEPGKVEASFESNKVETEAITGSSFVAYQAGLTTPPQYFVGAAASTPEHTLSLSNLFPFAKLEGTWKPEKYTVYAGDCKANEPSAVGAANHEVAIEPGVTSKVKVEAPEIGVTVYENSKTEVEKGKIAVVSSPEYAMIINTECSGITPVNSAKAVTFEHPVKLEAAGHLEAPYRPQPYAKSLKLCVVAKLGGSYYKYTSPAFANKTAAGTTITSVYMKNPEKAGEYEKTATAGKFKCP